MAEYLPVCPAPLNRYAPRNRPSVSVRFSMAAYLAVLARPASSISSRTSRTSSLIFRPLSKMAVRADLSSETLPSSSSSISMISGAFTATHFLMRANCFAPVIAPPVAAFNSLAISAASTSAYL